MLDFKVRMFEIPMIDEVLLMTTIKFNPSVDKEINSAWEENNELVKQGYEHTFTGDHEDGVCQVMVLQKFIGGNK
ncbi:hypothetical protein P4159_05735 [Bacillus thuringiensis]|uniref:hypothetical protein n=1 Tax=Bacillus cereus group TaxID=86661 RepID=UPI000CD7F33A|nr:MULTISPECIES: hypothetical protein [Bacillus cereus group]MEC3417088.1 hypothetical protein [Bacillus cereus]MEC3596907.1 hypothetical protein [Bacillus thuringiensis]MED1574257.1 hypothetical protein [Bacillus paranthracis]MED1836180.1 hypothetical protein [Bacillus thuringiensis]MED2670243.1 hypothetical protein [Bacillus thuringiensis]